ncbi:MAG: sulfite exporter TauE/SafE family protein [Lacibacter sp.]|jgi:sulfite exporter TauE/SafE
MLVTTIIAGFTLGLFGSLHCVGMCGPLALALPAPFAKKSKQITSSLFYNAGRVVTYSLLGLLFGLIGKSFRLIGFQQLFSIIAGSSMMVLTVLYFVFKQSYQPRWFRDFTWKIQSFIAATLQKQSGSFWVGMANGLLPCGMVYAAIAGALVSNSITNATVFMASFGLATVPALLLLMLFGSGIPLHIRLKLRKLTPLVMMVVAALLIFRGMNLGIPYISPEFHPVVSETLHCH